MHININTSYYYYYYSNSRSIIHAAPIPVPTHIDINPRFFLYVCSMFNKLTTIRAPVQPNG